MGRRILYREYDGEGKLIKLECGKCGLVRDVSEFSKCRSKKDGVWTTCKKCDAQRNAQYQQDNKEKYAQYQSQYRQDHKEELAHYYAQYQRDNKEKYAQYRQDHKEEKSQYDAQYYQDHKEKRAQYQSQYRQDHKEEIAQRKSRYYQDNKEKLAQQAAQYYQDHKEKYAQQRAQYYQDHKEERSQYHAQYRQDKADIEIKRIYKNVTQKLYPNSGVQYGVIYGVHCIPTNMWYIGQTIYSFDIRYGGDFFKSKVSELAEDNANRYLLDSDIEKFGVDHFEVFEVLDVAFSEKELDEKETYYIDYYNAYEEGYNSNRGNIFKHNKAKRTEQKEV